MTNRKKSNINIDTKPTNDVDAQALRMLHFKNYKKDKSSTNNENNAQITTNNFADYLLKSPKEITNQNINEQVKKLCDNSIENNQLCYAIEHFVEKLPIPNNDVNQLWDELEQPLETLKNLSSILDKYTDIYTNKTTHPKSTCTALTLFAICHKLAIICDKNTETPNLLKEYGIYAPFDKLEEDKFLTFFQPKDFQRWENIRKYFRNVSQKKKPLFNFNNFSIINITQSKIDRSIPDIDLYYRLLKEYPNLYEKYNKQIQDTDNEKNEVLTIDAKNNLSKTERCILEMLRCFSTKCSDNPLNDIEMSHLIYLKRSAYSCRNFLGKLNSPKNTVHCHCNLSYVNIDYTNSENYFSSHKHEGIFFDNPDSPAVYTELNVKKYHNESAPHEARAISHKNPSITDVSKAFIRSTGEYSLQPYQILYFLNNNINVLKDQHTQIACENMFFSHTYKDKGAKHFLNLVKFFKENDSAVWQCQYFINNGINFFYESQKDKKIDIETCLFFVRFAYNILPYLDFKQKQSFQKTIDKIEMCLSDWCNIQVNGYELSLIHAHKLYFFVQNRVAPNKETVKPNFL